MTNATDSPPVSAPADPSVMVARARELSTSLRSMAETWGLTPSDQATVVLNLSPTGLVEAMAAGALDGVIVGGQAYVVAEQVQLRVLDEMRTGAVRVMELRTQVRGALKAFLADREVCALWDEATGEQRPLVCARRGARFVHYGIEYHSVVLKAQWLAEYAMLPAVREAHPEIASLPIGPQLMNTLAELPGVTPIRYATPLAEQGERRPQSHRLTGWVRVDPRAWSLVVPGLITRLVNGEEGR